MNTQHNPIYRIAYFSLEGDLRDFISDSTSGELLIARFKGNPALKDTIESLGVPQVEVGKTEKDQKKVDLNIQLFGGERITIYPPKYIYSDKMVKTGQEVVLPVPPQFILDGHLGKLAVKMRMAGIDTDYETQRDDDQIVANAVNRDLIVLTRDVGLLKHKSLKFGRWIRSDQPLDQWIEVMRNFQLWKFLKPGARCTHCNTILDNVAFDHIAGRLPQMVRVRKPDVKKCPNCGHLYWRGTHFDNFMKELNEVVDAAGGVYPS